MRKVVLLIAIILTGVLLTYNKQRHVPSGQAATEIEKELGTEKAQQVLGAPAARTASEGYRVEEGIGRGATLPSGRIVILDIATEAPIAGAMVKDSGGTHVGTSDEFGAVAIQRNSAPEAGWKRIWIDANGYSSASRVFDWRDPELLIRMSRPVSIVGKVGTDSGILNSRCTVLAWPRAGGRPSLAEVASAIEGQCSGSIRCASTDRDGAFRIDGVSGSEVYSLLACGGGYLTREYSSVVPDEGTPVLLTVSRAYGMMVKLVGEDGGVSPVLHGRLARKTVMRGCDSLVADPMDVSDLGAVLAGLSHDLLSDESGALISLFYSDEDESEVEECWVHITCPGFRDMRVQGVARFLAYGPSEYEVAVIPTASGFGSIAVVPHGMKKEHAARMGSAFMLLSLTDLSSQEQLSLGTNLDLVAGATISDVPTGTYEWTMKGRDGMWRGGDNGIPMPLVVSEGEVSRLEIDMEMTGGLVLRPVLPSGEVYEGPLALGIARGIPITEPDGKRRMKGAYVLSQERGPYLLPLLTPGEYTLQGLGPKWGLPSDRGYLTLTVAAGETIEVELLLDQ